MAGIKGKVIDYDKQVNPNYCIPNRKLGISSQVSPFKSRAKQVDKFLEALTFNIPIGRACALVKLSYDTLRFWIRTGEKDIKNEVDSEYADFVFKYEKARAEGCKTLIDKWMIHCDNSWQAVAELASRLYPDDLGKVATINTNTNVQINHDVTLSLEERVSKYAEVIRAKAQEVSGEGCRLLPSSTDINHT